VAANAMAVESYTGMTNTKGLGMIRKRSNMTLVLLRHEGSEWNENCGESPLRKPEGYDREGGPLYDKVILSDLTFLCLFLSGRMSY
jgi:hypothetical protein